MDEMKLEKIGSFSVKNGEYAIILEKKYLPALKGLEGFGNINVLWWFDRCGNEASRSTLIEKKPYVNGPEEIGVFATRSPLRPNPLALSCVSVINIDHALGIITLAYADAADASPVLDIKPYTPSVDRVENPSVPSWCAHWPASCETSGEFDWESEFNF